MNRFSRLLQIIPTGGMLPDGSDAVVMIEHCEDLAGLINVFKQVAPGENVISVGEDIGKGALLLEKGTKLHKWKEVDWDFALEKVTKNIKETRDRTFIHKEKGLTVNRTDWKI